MTTKPRRPQALRAGRMPEPGASPEPVVAPEPVTSSEPAETATDLVSASTGPVVDRLVILDEYAGPDGLLPVVVAVSHDAVFAGQHIRVPITDRVAGLIEIGFLEVDLEEPGTW